jgi:glycosyltransferase involved in cell wall biosynthesis
MNQPKVSILIPTYNQAQYIKQAIDSALGQDYPNLEVIVSDDASTDETKNIVEQYQDERLKYYRNEKNIGRVANYRKLLYEYATGDYVLTLDGDDYLILTDAISKMINKIDFYEKKERESVIMVMALAKTLYGDSEMEYKRDKESCINSFNVFLNWDKTLFFHGATLFSRQDALKVGFYEDDIINTDVESFLKLCLANISNNVILLNETILVWRLHDNNTSLISDIDKLFKNLKLVEVPYQYAISRGYNKERLLEWKETMLLDRYNRMLSKILVQKDKKLLIAFLKRFYKEDKIRFSRVVYAPKNIVKISSFYVPFLFDAIRYVKWTVMHKFKPPKV